jgi:hypothetical protein
VLGQVYGRLGWAACVAGVGAALALAALLATRLAPSSLDRVPRAKSA